MSSFYKKPTYSRNQTDTLINNVSTTLLADITAIANNITEIAAVSAGWNSTQTTVINNSGMWVSAYNAIGDLSFNGSTIVNVVTATGEFLTLTVNGSARAIELFIY